MDNNKKTQFFFDEPEVTEKQEEKPSGFFEPAAGDTSKAQYEKDLSAELNTEKQAILEASMKEVTTRVVAIQFGTYQKNYAVHVRPTHPRKNLSTNQKLLKAIEESVKILDAFVPQTLTVEIHPPRNEWEVKVISFVVRNGADAWNFDKKEFEEKCVPKLLEEIEKVIME